MYLLRTFLLRHRALASLLVIATLCMKVMVPSGTMISSQSKVLTVEICADAMGMDTAKQISIPMKTDSSGKQAKGECPFAAQPVASLGGADPLLLAFALAFILALGFAPVRAALTTDVHQLRPPLRGPPALA